MWVACSASRVLSFQCSVFVMWKVNVTNVGDPLLFLMKYYHISTNQIIHICVGRQKWKLKMLKNNYTIPINTVYWACDTLPRSHAHVIVIGPCCACALRFNFSETVKVSNIYNEKNLTSNIAHSFDNGVKTIQKWIYIIHWIISTSNICFEYFDFVLSIGFSIYYHNLYIKRLSIPR